MDAMSSGNESDAEPMSKDVLEDICDGSQSYPSINTREARYRICDCFKQRQLVKYRYHQRETWIMVYTRYIRLLLIIFHKHYQFWLHLDKKFLTSFQNIEIFQK